MSCALSAERVWLDKAQYSDAERKFYESAAKNCSFVTEDMGKGESVGKSKRSKKARKEAKESEESECPHKGKKKEAALTECPVLAQVADSADAGKKKRSQKPKSTENSVSEAPEAGAAVKKSKSKRRKEKKAQEEAEDTSEEMETTSEHSALVAKDKTVEAVNAPAIPKGRLSDKKGGGKEDEKVLDSPQSLFSSLSHLINHLHAHHLLIRVVLI
ncbi:uncharacterized protein LOC132260886 isoform X2 [Phlebotomus argentipes]|uniref:uncharacterized protein LOC132260886 isoform X2 n=1 Tax=Phlebotomus argentipes TaxID=94469 RepID=UPI0028932F2A|nr:uncharacterized protein LOC132260886 isoform X2 [Phlebotomus argentipes]